MAGVSPPQHGDFGGGPDWDLGRKRERWSNESSMESTEFWWAVVDYVATSTSAKVANVDLDGDFDW
jgi:hypothetical protein